MTFNPPKTKNKAIKSAYRKGWEAAKAGQTRTQTPPSYVIGGGLDKAWQSGFDDYIDQMRKSGKKEVA